jgi:hypothetical protein
VRGAGERERKWEQGGKISQTMYAHVNKLIKNLTK